MGIILCPTRGGEGSHCSQDKAIELAKETGETLLFLHVFDLHFLDKTAAPIVVDVGDEVSQMGEFMLLMAKERAAEQGVQTKTISRKGEIREEIKKVALEEGVSLVLLGQPAGEESAFQRAEIQAFADEIEAETGIDTMIC